MKRTLRQIVIGTSVAVVAALGMAGSVSAGGGSTFCGYQAVDGSEQWVRQYVGRRQCPATDVSGGVQGTLVYSEYIA